MRGVQALGTADATSLPEPFLPCRRRRPTLVLPADPSEAALLQCWTRSSPDKEAIYKCRGEAQRRRFAVPLGALRTYGRFLPQAVAAPVAITNYLARQLDLPLVLFGEVPERLATETDHLQRIRLYLGWQPFDEAARRRLPRWLTQRATDDVLPGDLLARAEDSLRHWRIVLPAPSPWEELVASVPVRVQADISTRAVPSLLPALPQAIDDLLQVPSGERTSMLFQLKEDPPEASPAVLLRSMERDHFLHDLGVETMDLSSSSPPLIRDFAEMTKR